MAYRQDFLKRAIEQLAKAIAAALGFKQRGEYEQALDLLRQGYSALGVDPLMIERLDAPSLVTVLGAERAKALVELWLVEAGIHEARGDTVQAKRLGRRATELSGVLKQEADAPRH